MGPIVFFTATVRSNTYLHTVSKELVSVMREEGCDVFVGCPYHMHREVGATELEADEWERQCMIGIDRATHIIAEVSALSTDIGRIIEYGRLKGKLGKSPALVMCLFHRDVYQHLPVMIKGMTRSRYLNVHSATYGNPTEAKELVREFLTRRP